jgi:type II secretory pathway pseudopilin PulG
MIKEKGFAYLALLLTLSILMLALTSAAENISQQAKREREQQLFFVGEQFRNAIASYYENSPSADNQFPKSMAGLLRDNRFIKPVHHLRQLYRDPITNDVLWGEMRNEQQQIIGLYSLSNELILMTDFDPSLVTVNGNKHGNLSYSDLKFMYTPTQQDKK